MTVPLRWKIPLLAVLAPLVLGLGSLWAVNQHVSRRVYSDIRQELEAASAVFGSVYATRARELASAAEVIARDPRFFSALALPAGAEDRHLRATVRSVARDFGRIAAVDLFEVFDARGRRLATVGPQASVAGGRAELVRQALAGRATAGVLAGEGRQYQVAARPVMVDRRVVGAVVLGTQIGDALAAELRGLTRSEVSFLSGSVVTGSSLASAADRLVLREAAEERADPVVHAPSGTYLTLSRSLPGAGLGSRHLYVLQRSLDGELAFLRRLQADLVRLAVAVVLAAVLIGLLVARAVVHPISRLVRGAEAMEQGDYDYPLGGRGHDEIGYLTERFRHMRGRQRAYVESLEEVARVKSQFLSVASHELRTPVTIIQAYGELLADGSLGPVTPEQRQALGSIAEGLGRIVRITEDATFLAGIERQRAVLRLEPCDVAAVVEAALHAAVAEAVGRRVAVDADVAPGLGRARLDGPRLSQAVANLIRNGIRFTPDGGAVRVRARREAEWLVIEVADTGIGMPAEQRQRLLDRAATLRDPRHHHSSQTLEFNSGGLGLGLPIARGIVEAHGGSLTAESRPGEGSTFTLRLPVEFLPAAAGDAAAEAPGQRLAA